MTVKQLRAFLAVAQTLSFTQACERLHLSQPALSLAIKGLEDSLGGKLLIRSTRSVRLTPRGSVPTPSRQAFASPMGQYRRAAASALHPPAGTTQRGRHALFCR